VRYSRHVKSFPFSRSSSQPQTYSCSDVSHSGTTLSYLPQSSIAAIFLNVPGSRLLSDGVTTTFPCDAKFSVGFTFGKQTFVISKNDLIYNKNIAGVGCTSTLVVGDSAQVLLGDIFCEFSCPLNEIRNFVT
jgi:hypothetical protein